MYEQTGSSVRQRLVLAVGCGACVLVAWWLLAAGGLTTVGAWVGRPLTAGDPIRRLCIAAAFSTYYVRLLFTQFVFLRRGLGWSEVFSVVPWVLFIVLLVSIEGGRNPAPLRAVALCGMLLFLAGSWINSRAEYTRHVWKLKPENHGKLYTGGLFRYTRHPNYFGDLVSFSGICLLSGAWITVVIPIIMFAGFAFVNVPALDAHLHDHYGEAFEKYARHTPKLIPFLY
jgi:protein-S-isoprenylcysteine O-methyltransferase Ste14